MRRLKVIGLCLGAILAIAAIGASSAAALPEWAKCEAKAGGKYKNANCTEKVTKGGTYELLTAKKVSEKRVSEGKSKNVPFTGENVGASVLDASFRPCVYAEGTHKSTRKACEEKGISAEEGSGHVGEEGNKAQSYTECTAEHNSGETLGANGVTNVTVVFTGCSEFGGALPCTSPGASEGEVKVNALKGKLGYISKSEHKVGLLLEPAKAKGRFAEFVCGGVAGVVVGVGNNKEGAEYVQGTKYPSGCFEICPGATTTEEAHGGWDGIISRIEPVNQTTSEFKQVYTVKNTWGHGLNSEAYQNVPSGFEGAKHPELLESYLYEVSNPSEAWDWSAAGEEITNSSRPEEPGEIRG